MIEKRLGYYVPVCTRTRRVRTGGHSTGGWCWKVLASSCNCIRVQRSLKVTWRPKACFGSVGRNQRSGHAVRGWFEALSSKGRNIVPSPMFSDILDLPSVPRKWASRMLRAMHAPDNPLTANRRWELLRGGHRTWRNVKRQQCAPLVKGFQNTTRQRRSTVMVKRAGRTLAGPYP